MGIDIIADFGRDKRIVAPDQNGIIERFIDVEIACFGIDDFAFEIGPEVWTCLIIKEKVGNELACGRRQIAFVEILLGTIAANLVLPT